MKRLQSLRRHEVALAALAAFCVIGDSFLFRTAFFNADYVQSFNELAAFDHGNLFLHGFSVTSDNFYLTDLPFYVLASLLGGIRPPLIFIVPYLVFMLFLTGCSLLVWRAGGTPKQRHFGVAAVLVTFGIPYGWPQSLFLVSNEHGAGIMLSIYALLSAQEILRGGALKPGLLAVFCALVFCLAASDQLSDAYLTLPFFILFALRAWIYRRACRAEVLLFGYLFCAVLLGTVVPGLIGRHDGFITQQNFSLQFIPFIPDALKNAEEILINLAFLFNAAPAAYGGMAGSWLLAAARLPICLGFAMLCGRVIWRLPVRRPDVITQWLVAGGITLSALEISSQFFKLQSGCSGGPPVCGIRFVTPVFVYLGLAGIIEGQALIAELASSHVRRGLIAGFAALSLLFLAGGAARFYAAAGQPAFAQNAPQLALTRWLAARNLSYGVSDYWTSQLITAFSGGRVKTDTVIVTDKIQPGNWIGDMADLHAGRPPQFVVFNTGNDGFQGAGTKPLDLAAIMKAYGPPIAVYPVGIYQVALLRKADQ